MKREVVKRLGVWSVQWYSFDDVNTNKINEEEIVTKDAYILFYQKSSLSPSSSIDSGL